MLKVLFSTDRRLPTIYNLMKNTFHIENTSRKHLPYREGLYLTSYLHVYNVNHNAYCSSTTIK